MADDLRDSVKILNFVEPKIRQALAKSLVNLKSREVDQLMELQALMVEGYVRSANACFPRFPPQGGTN